MLRPFKALWRWLNYGLMLAALAQIASAFHFMVHELYEWNKRRKTQTQ